jgi:hypothetical protein
MKIEYEAETHDHGPWYYLTAGVEVTPGDEMRWLTILCDIAQRPDIVIRVIGAKRSNKAIPGQPSNPVLKLKIVIERRDGTAPRSAELLRKEVEALLDPTKRVKKQQSTGRTDAVKRAQDRNMRIVHESGSVVIEE